LQTSLGETENITQVTKTTYCWFLCSDKMATYSKTLHFSFI